jgi:hypothetical protein
VIDPRDLDAFLDSRKGIVWEGLATVLKLAELVAKPGFRTVSERD